MVDEKKIALRPAVEISYLTQEEQYLLLDSIQSNFATPSENQAKEMRRLSQENKLTADKIDEILGEEKPNQKEQLKFKVESIKEYFPSGYSLRQMQDIVHKLLKNYQLQWKNKAQAREIR